MSLTVFARKHMNNAINHFEMVLKEEVVKEKEILDKYVSGEHADIK
jgi:hypothetical protein